MALTGSPKNSDTGLSFPYSLDLLSGTTGNQKLGKESRSLSFLICCPLADPTACPPVVPPEGCDPRTAASTPDGIAANGPHQTAQGGCLLQGAPDERPGGEHLVRRITSCTCGGKKLVGRGRGKTEQLGFLPWVPLGTSAQSSSCSLPLGCHT